MHILIIDDDPDNSRLLGHILAEAGVTGLTTAESVQAGLHCLEKSAIDIDLILMDVVMPDGSGIDACRAIKQTRAHCDIPILMVTAQNDSADLEAAFASGAMDYITKPFKRAELLARVRSAYALKREMDCRKQREAELLSVSKQLQEANTSLLRLACLDGLTGISNRRHFNEMYHLAWRRAARERLPISLIMIDIDRFKIFNDRFGHLGGDFCLREVAQLLSSKIGRAGDMLARYGGEEFAVILADTNARGAGIVAETLRQSVEALRLSLDEVMTDERITISLGMATALPTHGMDPMRLIALADEALYQAKRLGRNRAEFGGFETARVR